MKKTDWKKITEIAADPHRVKQFLHSLEEQGSGTALDQLSADSARILAALVSGSQFLAEFLLANPPALAVFADGRVKFSRRPEGLRREVEQFVSRSLVQNDYAGALTELHRFKQREMLRIAARDLARLADVVEITRELSDVADVCLDAVLNIISKRHLEKFGRPFHQDVNGRWQATPFCIFGQGKLGGQELNYSSDVDLLFVYGDEGSVFKAPPSGKTAARPVISNHQYFCKLAEAFTAEVARATEEGFLYRVDLRLRPEGEAGPVARSLESYENYYAQWGQTWERMMLIKARCAAGDNGLASEFLEMIQPFRFPRSISTDILREIGDTKDRIENEVVRAGELERNVKLGRGGIREIEFIAQSLQILHAGHLPFLQTPQTLPCLAKLAQYELLARADVLQLDAAYRFLRDVEHRLQMENNLQTHTIPEDRDSRSRLARTMGFKSPDKFASALQTHAGNVRRIYETLLKRESKQVLRPGMPKLDGPNQEWIPLLAAHAFRDPEKAALLFKEFGLGPGYLHVSQRTTELAEQLVLKFLSLCPAPGKKAGPHATILSDPDRVLARLDSFVAAYGSRATLFELWNNNPKFFELLLLLFDRSEFLASVAICSPDLIEGLLSNGRLFRCKTAAEILKDLRFGLRDPDQFLWLRRYHETELMRLGLRDIPGQVSIEQTPVELSALADACLQYCLEVVLRKYKIKSPPFAIVGLGKLGGAEIAYGSDLDVVFVTEKAEKDLPRLQKFAAEIMDLLSRRTDKGIVFRMDARLRPDGEKGLLVQTLDACESYYRNRAQLWEIQMLTRARFVAGDIATGKKFEKLAAGLTDFSRKGSLALKFKDWKKEIHHMRMRIEKERTPAGKDDLAIKTGRGGLMDAEFIAQVLCMENGWHEPNTLRALERARERKTLPDAKKLIENYRQLRRVEAILRRWSDEGEAVLPDDEPAFYRVSVRCGFDSPGQFRAALSGWRTALREAYYAVFAR